MPRAVPYPCAWLAVPDRAWRPDGEALTPAEAMVLAVLVDRWRVAEADVVVVSSEELARASGLSVRGAETARASLLERKLVARVHEGGGRGRASTYRLGAWRKSVPKTPHENPAMAAETPHGNPAAAAWIDEKPAANPARNPAAIPTNGAGFSEVAPSSEDQRSESEEEREERESARRELLREALLGAFGRRWCSATRSLRWPPAASDRLVELVLVALEGAPDPLGLIDRGLDRYFAWCRHQGIERPEFGWPLARDFGRWCGSPRPLASTSPDDAGVDEQELQLRRSIERFQAEYPANPATEGAAE